MRSYRSSRRNWRKLIATDRKLRLLSAVTGVVIIAAFALAVVLLNIRGYRDEMASARNNLPMSYLTQAQRQILLLENDVSARFIPFPEEIRLKAEAVQVQIDMLAAHIATQPVPGNVAKMMDQLAETWVEIRADLDQWLTLPTNERLRASTAAQLTNLELQTNSIFEELNAYGLSLGAEADKSNNQLILFGVAFGLSILLVTSLFSVIIGRLADVQMQSLMEKESISRFPEQNPNPVMRFDADFKQLYGNSASSQLEKLLGLKEGVVTRPKYRNWLNRTLSTGKVLQTEGKVGDRFFRLMSSLVEDERVINVYCFDVTEIKRAEMNVRSQLDRLQALHVIDLAIASPEGQGKPLDVVLEQSCRLLGMDAAALFIDVDQEQLTCAAARGFGDLRLEGTKVSMAESLAGKVATEQKALLIPDLATTSIALPRELSEQENFQAFFAAPLLVRGQLVGVMEVFGQQPFTPPKQWLDFLMTLAGQAAIAIDNSRLFEGLQQSNVELRQAYDSTLEGWAKALELRDEQTEGHSRRVTDTTLLLAKELKVPRRQWENIYRGAVLHDIGKMAVPDRILLKPGPLTEAEWNIMKRHPENAYEMLHTIGYLRDALDIPRYHHEKWDGSGYNFGLKGEDIPLAARIFAIADVWDALRAERPYRKGMSEKQAWEIIQQGRGLHFDPRVVDAFEKVVIRPILGQSKRKS